MHRASTLNNENGSTKLRCEIIVKNHGIVATDGGHCSRIGMGVLREGGQCYGRCCFCCSVLGSSKSNIKWLRWRSLYGNQTSQQEDTSYRHERNCPHPNFPGSSTLKASGALSVAVLGELAGLHKAWKVSVEKVCKACSETSTLRLQDFTIPPCADDEN